LNLALPEVGTDQAVQLHDALFGQAHKFFNYALSFILLALFWNVHHVQFHFIKRTNRTHLWINIFCLMFVVLVPFSTSLTGDYNHEAIAKLFFDLDPRRIAIGKRRGAVTPIVALMAMGLSVITPQWSSCVYLLIPVLLAHPQFRYIKSTET
jgi:hypothetical protein